MAKKVYTKLLALLILGLMLSSSLFAINTTAFASKKQTRAGTTNYQLISAPGYYHFNEVSYITSTAGGTTNDILVADYDSKNKVTNILRFDNATSLGQQALQAKQPIAKISFLFDKFGISKTTTSEYLITLADKKMSIYDIATTAIVKSFDNVSDFEEQSNAVYFLQNDSTGSTINKVNLPTLSLESTTIVLDTSRDVSNLSMVEIAETLDKSSFIVTQKRNFIINVTLINNRNNTQTPLTTIYNEIKFIKFINNVIYYSDYIGTLYAYDISSKNTQTVANLGYSSVSNSYAFFVGVSEETYKLSYTPLSNLTQTPKILLQSKSSANGFFNTPTSVFSRNGQVYVADSNNSRIHKIGDGQTSYVSTNNTGIYSVAASRENQIYSLRQSSSNSYTLSTIDGSSNELQNTTTDDNKLGTIVLDAFDNAYSYFGNQLYSYNGKEFAKQALLDNNIIAIKTAPDKAGIFVLTDSTSQYTISYFAPNASTPTGSAFVGNDTPVSFAVDWQQNYFVLYNNGSIQKFDSTGKTVSNSKSIPLLALGGQMDMAISMADITVQSGQTISAGDLLITHADTNALVNVGWQYVGVEIPDWDNYIHPSTSNNSSNATQVANTIKTVSRTTTLYNYPTELKATNITLSANDKVIVVDDTPNGDSVYTYVMLDRPSAANDKLPVVGYVLSSMLNVGETDKYIAPPQKYASIGTPTPLYRFPTTLSVALNVNEDKVLTEKTPITLLDFAKYVVGEKTWFRVQVEDFIGYIEQNNINFSQAYRPGSNAPRPNAVIKGDNVYGKMSLGSTRDDGQTTIEYHIPNNTRVYVVGTFNVQSATTRVKFYDETYNAVIEVAVPTSSVDYDNITVMQVAAFFIAILMVAVTIIVILMYKNKKAKSLIENNFGNAQIIDFEIDSDLL